MTCAEVIELMAKDPVDAAVRRLPVGIGGGGGGGWGPLEVAAELGTGLLP